MHCIKKMNTKISFVTLFSVLSLVLVCGIFLPIKTVNAAVGSFSCSDYQTAPTGSGFGYITLWNNKITGTITSSVSPGGTVTVYLKDISYTGTGSQEWHKPVYGTIGGVQRSFTGSNQAVPGSGYLPYFESTQTFPAPSTPGTYTLQLTSSWDGRNLCSCSSCSAGTFTVTAPAYCTLPWGGTISNGASVYAYYYPSVACGLDCANYRQTRTCNNGVLSNSNTYQSCYTQACASCSLPWGGTVAHGGSVTAYASGSVPCGSSCTSQTRTCSNGTLSGSYTNSSCSVAACACNLPWGGTLTHGGSVTAYASGSVPCGSSCTSQTRTCSNGTLSGSYTNSSCSVAACASCTSPWGTTVVHGSSITAYLSNSAATCTSQTRTCNNGTLSGSYIYQTCTRSCTLPWGGTVASGSSFTAYQSSSVPYGSSCVSQTRTCTDGTLSGSYSNQTCNVAAPASCSLPWGGTVAHGGSVTAYASGSVPCGSSCTSQTRTCSNGTLSGSYTNSSCSVTPCPCTLPWGGTLAHGSSVTAYLSSSAVTCTSQTRTCNNGTLSGSYTYQSCLRSCAIPWGGTVASGSSFTAYQSNSVPCGSSCTSQTRTCTNGTLTGSYSNRTCSVAPCPCTSPWGTTVAHGSSITAYSSSSVACGSSCDSVKQNRTCTNGVLSGTATNQNCSVAPCPCTTPWGTTVASGSSVDAYKDSYAPYGSECVKETRQCTDGSLNGSYTNQSCCQADNCEQRTCQGKQCNNGCKLMDGVKTDGACCVSNGCEKNTCKGKTCNNGCISNAYGTKKCSGPVGPGIWTEIY